MQGMKEFIRDRHIKQTEILKIKTTISQLKSFMECIKERTESELEDKGSRNIPRTNMS